MKSKVFLTSGNYCLCLPKGKGEKWRQVNQTSHTRGSEFDFFSNAY